MSPPVVSVVGWSGSGKTTLLEKLIAHFTAQGVRVGTIKHDAHEFQMDTPGKDTWRHAQAGAVAVAIASATRFAVLAQTSGPEPLTDLIRRLPPVDLVLTEGFRAGGHPKIVVWRQARGGEVFGRDDPSVIAYAADVPLPVTVPQYGLDDVAGLAERIRRVVIRPP